MFRTTLALALFAAVCVAPTPGAQKPESLDAIPRHPILVADTSGSTLLGFVHRHLTVYGDGHAFFAEDGRAWTAQLDKSEVARLMDDLDGAGAWFLQDQKPIMMDVPLTTVTVLSDLPFAMSHSFSFYGGGAYGRLQDVLAELYASTAPR